MSVARPDGLSGSNFDETGHEMRSMLGEGLPAYPVQGSHARSHSRHHDRGGSACVMMGQQRDRSERSAMGRTAVPREEAVHAAPAKQADRRAEPRRGTTPPSPQKDDAAPSRAGRDTSNAARRRWHDRHPQAVPAQPPWCPEVHHQPPCPIAVFNPFPNREYRRPAQRDGHYRPRYRRPYSGLNVIFVPYAAPVVVERKVVVEREVVNEAAARPCNRRAAVARAAHS